MEKVLEIAIHENGMITGFQDNPIYKFDVSKAKIVDSLCTNNKCCDC